LAYLTDEEYSQVVNLAQKSNGSNNAGNAGNNDIAPPMDVETAQKRFDQLDKIQLPSLEEVAEKHKVRAIINQEDINNY
jgi:phosphomevalonate kinase